MQVMCGSLIRHVKNSQKKPKQPETQNRWFTLPREIRDMVYREVLCKKYLVQWSARWERGKAVFNDDRPLFWFRGRHWSWRGLFWMIKRPLFWADIALLLTSQAISQEAIDIMYEGSSFCVYLGQRSIRWYRMTPLPSQQLLARMQNFEIGMCVCDTLDRTVRETWFKNFDGSHTMRNTCRISFPCYYCLLELYDDHAPFSRACRSLVGFKAVTITLQLPCAHADLEEEVSELCTSMREGFKTALEPDLGPGHCYDVEHVFSLEFHPRKYLEDVQAVLPTSAG